MHLLTEFEDVLISVAFPVHGNVEHFACGHQAYIIWPKDCGHLNTTDHNLIVLQ